MKGNILLFMCILIAMTVFACAISGSLETDSPSVSRLPEDLRETIERSIPVSPESTLQENSVVASSEGPFVDGYVAPLNYSLSQDLCQFLFLDQKGVRALLGMNDIIFSTCAIGLMDE